MFDEFDRCDTVVGLDVTLWLHQHPQRLKRAVYNLVLEYCDHDTVEVTPPMASGKTLYIKCRFMRSVMEWDNLEAALKFMGLRSSDVSVTASIHKEIR